MYQAFAGVYDRLMRDVDYQGWADFYAEILLDNGLKQGQSLLECGCGTGSLSLFLARQFRLAGLELSADMLAVAEQKLRQEGLEVPLLNADMCAMPFRLEFDGIIASCDAVNYLNPSKIARFFKSAFQALLPGGVLAFDLSSIYKLKTQLGNKTLSNDEGDCFYLWENRWLEKSQSIKMSLTIFSKSESDLFERIDEVQTQYAYSPKQLRSLLSSVGFVDCIVYGDRHRGKLKKSEKRLHLVALKPGRSEL